METSTSVALTLCIGCLGIPTTFETPIGYLRFESSTKAAILKNEKDNIINSNITETLALELNKINSTKESPMIQSKVFENSKKEEVQNLMEIEINDKDNHKIGEKHKSKDNISNDKENHKKDENHKFKDSPKDVTQEEIQKQSETWKDFENDFSLFEHRLPDLTEEEFIELNKEGAIPWSFLKSLGVRENLNYDKPNQVPVQTPIYITVPIVINTHSTLPISLTIGGQNVPLDVQIDNKDSSIAAPNVKVVTGSVTTTSNFNNYAKPPARDTNRHRNNIRSKIYARNNNHNVQEFEYKQDFF